MAAPGGFDPTKSLLPEGGGMIHAMQGGGFPGAIPTNPMNSLLEYVPESNAPIHRMEGGVNNSQGTMTPQPNVPLSSATPGATPSATDPGLFSSTTSSATPVTSTSVATPISTETTPLSSASTGPGTAVPSQEPSSVPASNASSAPVANGPSVPASNASSTNGQKKNNKKQNQPLIEGEKRVTVFGMDLVLQKPKEGTNTFTKDQEKVFDLFGIKKASPSFQKEVLTALYEGSCDTTKSLMMLESCQPIRKLVQSLGLHLLSRMQEKYNQNNPTSMTEVLQNGEMEEENAVQASKSFSSQAQKDKEVNDLEEQLKQMDESLFGLRGIENPDAIACYCNTTIQLFFSIPEIRSKLLSYSCTQPLTDEQMAEEKENSNGVLCALHDLFMELQEETHVFGSKENATFDQPAKALKKEKVEYIMKQFKLKKKLQGDLQDPIELIVFLLELFKEKSEWNGLFDSFSVFHKQMAVLSSSNGPLNINEGHSDVPVLSTRLSIPELIQHIQNPNHSPHFQEEKKEFEKQDGPIVFSTTSLLNSYQYAEQKTDPNLYQGAPFQSQSTFEPSVTNEYLLFEIISADQMQGLDPSIKQRMELKVEPRIDIGDKVIKSYVYFGSILYTPSINGSTPHYTFERANSIKIHENPDITTLQDIDRILYNDSTVKKQTDEVHKLSKEARILVYRSEEAIEKWKGLVKEHASRIESTKKISPTANAVPPTLESGEAYRRSLRLKILDKAAELKEKVEGYTETGLFESYDTKKTEMDASLVALIKEIEETKRSLGTYLTTYQNKASSPEQEAAYHELEAKIQSIQTALDTLHDSLFKSTTSQLSLVHQLARIRNQLEANEMALTVHLADMKQSWMEEEEVKNVEQGAKWPSLYTRLHERKEDRLEVVKPFENAIQSIDPWMSAVIKREQEVERMKRDYVDLVKNEIPFFLDQLAPLSKEEEKEGIYSDQAYQDELLKDSNGWMNKTAQMYYDEMKEGEEYKQADEEFKREFAELERLVQEMQSISQSIAPLISSNPSSDKEEAVSPMSNENDEKVPLSDQQAATATAASSSESSSSESSSSESIPIIEPPSAMSSTIESNEQQDELVMENTSSSSSSTPPGPILLNESNQNKNLAELPGGLVGGRQSEKQDQMDQLIVKMIESYTQLQKVVTPIVVTKKKVIQGFKEREIDSELSSLQQRIDQDEQTNQQGSLRPITAIRRNMIRLDLRNRLQLIQTEFTGLMDADQKTDIELVNGKKTVIHQSYENVEKVKGFENDLLNAYYHFLIKDIKPPVAERLRDITMDPIDFKVPFDAKMEQMNQTISENHIEKAKEKGDAHMKSLRDAVDAYHAAVVAGSNITQLSALRQSIMDTLHTITEWSLNETNILDEYQHISKTSSSDFVNELYEFSDKIDRPIHNIIKFYDDLIAYHPTNEHIFEWISPSEHEKLKERVQSIKKRLEAWEDSLSDFSNTERNYSAYYEKAKSQVSTFDKEFRDYIRDHIHTSNEEKIPDADKAAYKAEYQNRILQGKVMKIDAIDDAATAATAEDDEKYEHPTNPSLTEKVEQLNALHEEMKDDYDHLPIEQIKSYLTLADEVIPLYDTQLTALQTKLDELRLQQEKNVEEKDSLESESKSVHEQIQSDQKLNLNKKSLTTNPKFFSQLQIELEVRQEVTEYYQRQLENQQRKIDEVKSQMLGVNAEIEQLTSRKELLHEKMNVLSRIHVDKMTAEEKQQQIQSAYHVELMEEALPSLEENIQMLEKEVASADSTPEYSALLEKKKKKLKTLQELVDVERAKVGTYQRSNSNKAPSEPREDILQALTQDANTEENRKQLNEIKKERTSRVRLSDYLQRIYPESELKENEIRSLYQTIKAKSKVPMKEIIKGFDPDRMILKTGIELGIFSPEMDIYQDYIDGFLEGHKQDEFPMQFFDALRAEFDRISIYLPTPGNAKTNYLINYLDDFMKLYEKVLHYAADKNQTFEDTLQVEIQTDLDKLRQKLMNERNSLFEGMAKRVETKEQKESGEKLNNTSTTITLDEYRNYRQRIELLYAIMDKSFEPQLFSLFKRIYDMKIEEMKKSKEREEEERKQEEEKKRQEEEKAMKNAEESKHKKNRESYVKYLQDIQTAISLFDSIPSDKTSPPEWKNLETELVNLYDQFETYRTNLKNLPKTNEVKNNYIESFTPRLNGILEIQTRIDKMNASSYSAFNTKEYQQIKEVVLSITSNIPEFLSVSFDSLLRENEVTENRNRYREFTGNRTRRKNEKARISAEEEKKRKERENRIQALRTKKQTQHAKELKELSDRMKKVESGIKMRENSLKRLYSHPTVLGLRTALGRLDSASIKQENKKVFTSFKNTKNPTKSNITEVIRRFKEYKDPEMENLKKVMSELEAKKSALLQVNLNEDGLEEDEKEEPIVKKRNGAEETKTNVNPFIPPMLPNNSVRKNREAGIIPLNQRKNLKHQLQELNTKYKKLGDLAVQMNTLLRDKEQASRLIELVPMLKSIGYLTNAEEKQFKSYSQDRLLTEMQFKKKRVNDNMEMIPMEKNDLERKLNYAIKAVNSASYNEYIEQVPSSINRLTKKEFNKLKIQQLDNDFEILRGMMSLPYSEEHYREIVSILNKHKIDNEFVQTYDQMTANQKKNNKEWDKFLDQARTHLADKKSDLMSDQQGGRLKKSRKKKRVA